MEKYTLEHKGDNNACGDELDFNLWWDFKNNNSCIVSLQTAMKEAHAKSDGMIGQINEQCEARGHFYGEEKLEKVEAGTKTYYTMDRMGMVAMTRTTTGIQRI